MTAEFDRFIAVARVVAHVIATRTMLPSGVESVVVPEEHFDINAKRLSDSPQSPERRRRLAGEDLRHTSPANTAEVRQAVHGESPPRHEAPDSSRDTAVEGVHALLVEQRRRRSVLGCSELGAPADMDPSESKSDVVLGVPNGFLEALAARIARMVVSHVTKHIDELIRDRVGAARERRLLTLRAAARRLGVDYKTTMRRLLFERQLVTVRVGQRFRVPLAEIERFEEQGEGLREPTLRRRRRITASPGRRPEAPLAADLISGPRRP